MLTPTNFPTSNDLSIGPTRTIVLNTGDSQAKRQEILKYFHETFSLYENLFSLLNSDESFYQMADPLRHPLIFYYAHTATFFVNKLITASIISERINPEFEAMFSVGVDEMSWDDLNRTTHQWPSVKAISEYRHQVRSLVENVITKINITIPISWHDPAWIILMGIEHERIHLETSSVLIRQLPLEFVASSLDWQSCKLAGDAPINQLVSISGSEITLGKSWQANTYGWDNEYGVEQQSVRDFKASVFLVSNTEYLDFVLDGGYESQSWWTAEGWNWCQYLNVKMPRFWRLKDNTYFLRLMTEEIEMPWNWPVEVNYLEARAFCVWKSQKINKPIRLPTEAEWFLMREAITENYPHWEKPVGNIDLAYFASSCPVDMFKQGELYDVVGNVWQWTETPITPFQGFQPHPAYDDFSIPTFDSKHNIMKGGSWISTGNEVIKESRYAFRRHFYQHAGFRYIESDEQISTDKTSYESDELLALYLEFHYGQKYFSVDNFPKVIADIAISACKDIAKNKALDLGCAVGRTAFELSRHFEFVNGVDFSARFINSAAQLQTLRKVQYAVRTEGELFDIHTASLDEMKISIQQAKHIHFSQGDACNLHQYLTDYDLIVAANLIDRLYDPVNFLNHIHERLNPGGILVLSSPYTWLEEYTEKSKWLGGFKRQDKEITTLQTISELLAEHFVMLGEPQDVPFVIRETQRKFQHTVAQVTVWQKV